MTVNVSPSAKAIKFWLWMFPLAYAIHVAEEYWGGEGYPAYIFRLRGVHMTAKDFLLAQSVGFVLLVLGVILSQHFKFPQQMLILLAAVVFVNGITHIITSLSAMIYGPGLWSSILIWLPLGVFILIRFRKGMPAKRYWLAVGIGVGINLIVGILTMRGARLT
jgi:hypothetical protein